MREAFKKTFSLIEDYIDKNNYIKARFLINYAISIYENLLDRASREELVDLYEKIKQYKDKIKKNPIDIKSVVVKIIYMLDSAVYLMEHLKRIKKVSEEYKVVDVDVYGIYSHPYIEKLNIIKKVIYGIYNIYPIEEIKNYMTDDESYKLDLILKVEYDKWDDNIIKEIKRLYQKYVGVKGNPLSVEEIKELLIKKISKLIELDADYKIFHKEKYSKEMYDLYLDILGMSIVLLDREIDLMFDKSDYPVLNKTLKNMPLTPSDFLTVNLSPEVEAITKKEEDMRLRKIFRENPKCNSDKEEQGIRKFLSKTNPRNKKEQRIREMLSEINQIDKEEQGIKEILSKTNPREKTFEDRLKKMSVKELKDKLNEFNEAFDQTSDMWFIDKGIPMIEEELKRRGADVIEKNPLLMPSGDLVTVKKVKDVRKYKDFPAPTPKQINRSRYILTLDGCLYDNKLNPIGRAHYHNGTLYYGCEDDFKCPVCVIR